MNQQGELLAPSIEDALRAERDALKKNIALLLNQIAESSHCKGCGVRIWWVTHRNGRKAPYTDTGMNHFIDCVAAAQFKKAVRP